MMHGAFLPDDVQWTTMDYDGLRRTATLFEEDGGLLIACCSSSRKHLNGVLGVPVVW